MKTQFLPLLALLFATSVFSAGCGLGPEIDTTYGRSRGPSINGTSAFAEILRSRGHEVRAAIRATDTLAEWTDTLIRFSTHPGPPDLKEADWMNQWLSAKASRKVIYIPRDFDTEPEFWDAMLAAEPPGTDPETLKKITRKRDFSRSWASELPSKPKIVAKSAEWFALDPKSSAPAPCKTLDGPWSVGVDAKAAAVLKHEFFKPEGDEVILLRGDGSPLAMTWHMTNGGKVLVVANASYLLNAALLNRARHPLTMRVADWIGPKPQHIAFFEGRQAVVGEADSQATSASPFWMLETVPINWIAVHVLIFLFLLAFSFAVRLGPALPELPSGIERPSFHPEALGALLAKTGRSDAARFLLDSYRRWRHPSHAASRPASASLPSR